MIQPPDDVIQEAIDAARKSPCQKRKVGAVVYMASRKDKDVLIGHNGPPGGECDGSDSCRRSCRDRCVHAEMRALRGLSGHRLISGGRLLMDPSPSEFDLVHVKLDSYGNLEACTDGPSCMRCAVEILDICLGGVWLYEAVREEMCPHVPTVKRTDCGYCQGWACDMCDGVAARQTCDHDVLDRHGVFPTVEAQWVHYTADEFLRATRANLGVY